MLIPRTLLVPHLPTLLLDEHRGHHTPMLSALAEQAARLQAESPELVVVLSGRWKPDGPFRVDASRRHRTLTDYPGFGVEVRYDCAGHPAAARALVEAGQKRGVAVGSAQRGVDSGVTVPLHFLLPRPIAPVVPLATATRPVLECRAWGEAIRAVLAARPERALFLVGGLLSHDAHSWALKRDVPEARSFDEHTLAALTNGDWSRLAASDPRVAAKALPEAELRHLEVLRGFLGDDVPGRVHCYESGPGVGAALVEFALPAVAASPDRASAPPAPRGA
jgi:aromatic ring-opening dioxygenase catalytic subunit (LigB family)